jgi:hypothetical protein
MKKITILSLVAIALLWITSFISTFTANYKFKTDYLSDWVLADKSSTLVAKSEYIDKFVENLQIGEQSGDFSTHSAFFLKNDANAFSENLKALKTLQSRLYEVRSMDPSSFEYNNAIQQITAQEQGEASEMINVFSECYTIKNYPLGSSFLGSIFIFVGAATFIALGLTAIVCWDKWD